MDSVVHFEMPAEDRQRMADFYSRAFGWKMEMLGEDMGNYVVVTTTEVDPVTQRPVRPGAINGGFYLKNGDSPNQYPSIVIAVDNLSESIGAVKEAGGSVDEEPYDIPGVGKYVSVIDTEGNRVSLLQPVPMTVPAGKS